MSKKTKLHILSCEVVKMFPNILPMTTTIILCCKLMFNDNISITKLQSMLYMSHTHAHAHVNFIYRYT